MGLRKYTLSSLFFCLALHLNLSAQNLLEEFYLTDSLIRNPMMIQISQDSLSTYADTLSDFEKGYQDGRGTARMLHAIAGPNGYVLIVRPWRYHPDDGSFAAENVVQPDFEDRNWEIVSSELKNEEFPQSGWNGMGWFRLHLIVDSALWNRSLAFNIEQKGASEIYLDGARIHQFGKLGRTRTDEQGYNPIMLTPEIITFTRRHHVITIRYSSLYSLDKHKFLHEHGFRLAIGNLRNVNESLLNHVLLWKQINNVITGILLAFAFLHFLIFLFSRRNSAHLYLALFTTFAAIGVILDGSDYITNTKLSILFSGFTGPYLCFVGLTGMRVLYSLFYSKLPRQFWYFLALATLLAIWTWLTGNLIAVILIMLLFVASLVEMLRVVIKAILQKQRGAWIIGIGFATLGVVFLSIVVAIMTGIEITEEMVAAIIPLITLGIFLSISLYLSQDIANTNKSLSVQTTKSRELEAENTRKEVELQKAAELRNTYLALEEAHASLKSTQAQLIQSEKMASLGQLTAGIAHEIQNPLNFVNNFSEVNKELLVEMKDEIDKGNLTDAKAIANDVIENQEKINHHGKRADAIVKGMLLHSRTSAGVKELTDINALAEEYLRLAYHGLRAKDNAFNATFYTELDKDLPKLNVVPQDIGRVILNLITNAFYAVSEKKKLQPEGYIPTVTVITQKLGHSIDIRVKDNGMGIPENIKDKIFQPFFTTKPTGQGTGLGLSLAYDIITKGHGGTLTVESTAGEGAVFIIGLPL